jgi:type I restriction enzyme S subunit
MSNNSKLTPKLRFPEFRKGAWVKRMIGDVLHETSRPIEMDDDTEYYLVTVKRRYGGVVSREVLKGSAIKVKSQFLVEKNDFLISKRQIVHNACGLVPGSLHGSIVSNEYSVLTPRENCSVGFFNYFAQQPAVSKSFLDSSVGIVIEKMLFKLDWWLKHEFLFPAPAEQQKIADCLSSLDELIAAEGRKWESLRAYKKGLMQQLFPRDGESVPQRRFPEFRDAGEWETRPLSVIGTNLDNRRIPIAEVSRTKGDIPYYGASGIVDYVKDYIFDEDLLCVSEDGANLVARTYPIAFSISGKTWVNNHAHVLRFEDSHTQKLAEDYLNSIDLRDYITGMAQPKLNRAMLDTIPIPLPAEEGERQQVAECLSSLNDQITAQAEQLSALQAHKKGLMQQLFPSIEEAEA